MMTANNTNFDLNYSNYYGADFLFSTKHRYISDRKNKNYYLHELSRQHYNAVRDITAH